MSNRHIDRFDVCFAIMSARAPAVFVTMQSNELQETLYAVPHSNEIAFIIGVSLGLTLVCIVFFLGPLIASWVTGSILERNTNREQ